MFVFFFQAEDGIRDYKVTGVQTCALPIWVTRPWVTLFRSLRVWPDTAVNLSPASRASRNDTAVAAPTWMSPDTSARSEERRVGKECRRRRAGVEESNKRPGTTGAEGHDK